MTASAFRRDERLILFTEYRHTQDFLVQRLKRAGFTSPEVQEYHGQSPALREAIKAAFNDPDSSVRILVSTDAASEGLNLQMSCRYVIHQDIPWNPMRLAQRTGRVDRHGQARDVHVWHFVCDDEADMIFLAHIARKVEQ